jgi:hypothetical protein
MVSWFSVNRIFLLENMLKFSMFALLTIDFTMAPINLSISITFVGLHGCLS